MCGYFEYDSVIQMKSAHFKVVCSHPNMRLGVRLNKCSQYDNLGSTMTTFPHYISFTYKQNVVIFPWGLANLKTDKILYYNSYISYLILSVVQCTMCLLVATELCIKKSHNFNVIRLGTFWEIHLLKSNKTYEINTTQ